MIDIKKYVGKPPTEVRKKTVSHNFLHFIIMKSYTKDKGICFLGSASKCNPMKLLIHKELKWNSDIKLNEAIEKASTKSKKLIFFGRQGEFNID